MRKVAVGVAEARLASAQAQVDQARATQEGFDLQLGYTRILAPVDGVVTRKFVEAGQTIQPGQGLLTLIPPASELGHRQLQGDPARPH